MLRPSILTDEKGAGRTETGPNLVERLVSRGDVAAVAACVLDAPKRISASSASTMPPGVWLFHGESPRLRRQLGRGAENSEVIFEVVEVSRAARVSDIVRTMGLPLSRGLE